MVWRWYSRVSTTAILEFLHFTSICLYPNLSTLFSEIKSVVLLVIHTINVVVPYIYDAAVYFQLFVGSSFVPTSEAFRCHLKYDSLEIVTIENWLHIVFFFPTISYWEHTVCYLVPTLSSLKWKNQRIHKSFYQWVLSIHSQLKKKKINLHI